MTASDSLSLFLLGFSSLMPLINPVGTALIINPYLANCKPSERRSHAFAICLSCFGLGLGALFGGSWALKFLGVSVPTTQMAGGLLIARMGLDLLSAKSSDTNEAPQGEALRGSLFYPLAFPLTLGPGGISVLITLSAHAHAETLTLTFERMAFIGLALLATLVATFFCFIYASTLIKKIGPTGNQVLNRLMAFLVFCVGLQMFLGGLSRTFPHLFQL